MHHNGENQETTEHASSLQQATEIYTGEADQNGVLHVSP